MSYKHNKSWRLRNPDGRNKQRKKYYKQSQNALNTKVRWNEVDLDEILMSEETDRILAARLGRSVQAIQNKRVRFWKEEEYAISKTKS